MKTFIKAIAALITIILLTINAFSQTPPPPNGGNNPTDPTSGNTPVGGGAPIGGGLIILLALGAGYGAKKIYNFRKVMTLEK